MPIGVRLLLSPMDYSHHLEKISALLSLQLDPSKSEAALRTLQTIIESPHHKINILKLGDQLIFTIGEPNQRMAGSKTIHERIPAELSHAFPKVIDQPEESIVRTIKNAMENAEQLKETNDRYLNLRRQIRHFALLVVILGLFYPLYGNWLFAIPFELSFWDYSGPILMALFAGGGIEMFARVVGNFAQSTETADKVVSHHKNLVIKELVKELSAALPAEGEAPKPLVLLTADILCEGVTRSLCQKKNFERILSA